MLSLSQLVSYAVALASISGVSTVVADAGKEQVAFLPQAGTMDAMPTVQLGSLSQSACPPACPFNASTGSCDCDPVHRQVLRAACPVACPFSQARGLCDCGPVGQHFLQPSCPVACPLNPDTGNCECDATDDQLEKSCPVACPFNRKTGTCDCDPVDEVLAASCPSPCPFNKNTRQCDCRPSSLGAPTSNTTSDSSDTTLDGTRGATEAPLHSTVRAQFASLVPPGCVSPCVWIMAKSLCECDPTRIAHEPLSQRTHVVVVPHPDPAGDVTSDDRVHDEL